MSCKIIKILLYTFSFCIPFLTAGAQDFEANLQKAYSQMDYDITEPYVKLDPYDKNPLTAIVFFNTSKPAKILFKIKGYSGGGDITHSLPEFKTQHILPILGLYPNLKNTIEIKATYLDNTVEKSQVFIQTPLIKKRFFYQPVNTRHFDKNRYYYLTDGIVLDEGGFIRFDFKTKNMAYWINDEIITESRTDGLERYSMLGKKLQSYPYPAGFTSFSHGIGQKPNHNFLVLGSFENKMALFEGQQQVTQRDFIIEIDYKTGVLVKTYDLAQILNPDRSVIIRSSTQNYGLNNWCHLNAVSYDETDKSVLVSCRHVGMIKVDEKTGSLKWIFGPNIGFEKSGRDGAGKGFSDKVLVAVDKNGKPLTEAFQKGIEQNSDFKWPTKTHDAKVIGNNLFSVFDNSGELYDKTIVSSPNSVASIFKVDAQKNTVQQIWKKELLEYSDVGSSVVYNPDLNDVVVFVAKIADKNQSGISYGKITRYDFTTQEVLFDALLYKGGHMYSYRIEAFQFYP